MAFAALQKDADTAISNNEREFILKARRRGAGRVLLPMAVSLAAHACALCRRPPPLCRLPPARATPAQRALAAATSPLPTPHNSPHRLQALRDGQRIDGRAPHELRPARLTFALDDSSCTLALGRTRVMAVVAATLDAPFGDRGNEGSLRFNVEFSPMASPAFEPGARARPPA